MPTQSPNRITLTLPADLYGVLSDAAEAYHRPLATIALCLLGHSRDGLARQVERLREVAAGERELAAEASSVEPVLVGLGVPSLLLVSSLPPQSVLRKPKAKRVKVQAEPSPPSLPSGRVPGCGVGGRVAEANWRSRATPPYQFSTRRVGKTVAASAATLGSVARRLPALRGRLIVLGARGIVGGHPQSRLDALLPWAYPTISGLKAAA